MSDSLNLFAKGMMRQEGGGSLNKRFIDIIKPPKNKNEDLPTKTSEAIIEGILQGLNGG